MKFYAHTVPRLKSPSPSNEMNFIIPPYIYIYIYIYTKKKSLPEKLLDAITAEQAYNIEKKSNYEY